MNKNTIDLKIKLLQKGIKQKDIAQKAKVDKSLVCNLIAGKIKSARVLKIIEEMLGGADEKFK